MANEQIIYLGPEEELTSVRERLERTQAGRIVLVIPPQTKLRSHVGWRLLRSRMRELDKDVLVISSDRQIRAVAKAAGFRVADSLESSPSNTPRPSNRPVRTGMGGKTSQGSRSQVGSGSTTNRSIRPGQQSNKRGLPWQQAPLASSETGSAQSRAAGTNAGTGPAASSTFEMQDLKFDSTYDLPIETAPPIHPVTSGREDDELDPLMEDYYVARSIREAAQGADAGAASSAAEMQRPSSSKPDQFSKMPPPGEVEDDPFAYMEDIQPVSLPEQRGSTFIHDIDPGVPDISDVPTDVRDVEIEDLGDEGEIIVPPDLSSHSWAEPQLEEPGMQEAPGMYGMPPRSSRIGNSARPVFEDLDDEDELLPVQTPIPDQPTRLTPSSPARSSGASTPSAAGRREPQPIIQPPSQTRNVSFKPATQQARKPTSTKGRRPVSTPPVSRRASAISNHRVSRITAIVFISLVVLVMAVLAFLYFGSNATITITVPSRPLNLTNLQYVASTNQHDTTQNTIPSEVLTHTASASDQGPVTGTIKEGNQAATGTVIFSNKGSQSIDIPTGTVISTSGAVAVQFVTTADALVQPDSSGSPQLVVPVQAQNPGESGNVAAGSISIIPPDSITKIAQYDQIPSTSVILTVTNPNSTTGGGAVNVQSVAGNDVQSLTQKLHQQLKNDINAWLAKAVGKKDVKGTVIPDVLGSPNPLPEEKQNLIITPAVGQPAPNGEFTGVLSVKVSVLVIRDAAIQAAARAQLMANAQQMKPAFVLATHLPVNVQVTNHTPSKDGTTLAITLSAAGQIVQRVSTQDISNMVAGKGADQAKSIIMNGQAGINEVVDTKIDLFPPFLGVMPFRPEQIHVIVQPGPVKGTPGG
jgi:baseplate J-like protein